MYKKIFKRFFDVVMALLGIVMLLPIYVLLTIFLYISNKGTPFYFQKRPGKNEKIFYIVKFKTMNDKKDAHGKLLPDHERLTSFGHFLRKYSLDEIPQLFNILIGNMSFIGPRPLLVKYLPYYTEVEKTRHHVKPGITGLSQISGRNFLGWDDRLKTDVYYVRHLSFKLDLQIFITTIKNVITSKDVAVSTNHVMKDLDETRKKD